MSLCRRTHSRDPRTFRKLFYSSCWTAAPWGEMDCLKPSGVSQDGKWDHQQVKESKFPQGARPRSWYWLVTSGRRYIVFFKSAGFGFRFLSHLSHPCGIRSDYWESCRWKQLLWNRMISTCLPVMIMFLWQGFSNC